MDSKTFAEFEAVVATPTGGGEQRAAILMKGKPAWQSNPKETDPGSKWTIVSMGRDLDGKGQPDAHFSVNTGGGNCCTTHYIYQLKPPVKRLAVYAAGSMGGGDFVELPGRKTPVMVSADDSSANAFAPYANSYFPLVILEVGQKGRLQFAQDLMQSHLPGMPPPVCTTPLASANPWLKERCAEYATARGARPARPTSSSACPPSRPRAPPPSSSGRTTSRTGCSPRSPQRSTATPTPATAPRE